MMRAVRAAALLFAFSLAAGEYPRSLSAYPGSTPVIDGTLSPY